MRKTTLHTTALVLALALAACRADSGGNIEQAVVERGDSGAYTITWSGASGPIDVYVADQPNATKDAMRLVVDNDTDGRASVTLQGKARPYFFVSADGGSGLWTAERVLPLEGGRNFRDLGGYATVDGNTVKWGKVFRSGSMAMLSPSDYDYLSSLGIRSVCDLRTGQERIAEPNKWVEKAGLAYWTRDYAMSGGDLGAMMTGGTSADEMKKAMIAMYRELPTEQAPAYREIFTRLAAGDTPLAFNCSAGKDRAGLASALILSALGVPDETVYSDYAMSENILKRSYKMDESKAIEAFAFLAKLPRETLEPLMASDPAYIRSAFASIRDKHGSVLNYVRHELGITDAQMARIRGSLLE
jgi:protein-tyrosine phosphatase